MRGRMGKPSAITRSKSATRPWPSAVLECIRPVPHLGARAQDHSPARSPDRPNDSETTSHGPLEPFDVGILPLAPAISPALSNQPAPARWPGRCGYL